MHLKLMSDSAALTGQYKILLLCALVGGDQGDQTCFQMSPITFYCRSKCSCHVWYMYHVIPERLSVLCNDCRGLRMVSGSFFREAHHVAYYLSPTTAVY